VHRKEWFYPSPHRDVICRFGAVHAGGAGGAGEILMKGIFYDHGVANLSQHSPVTSRILTVILEIPMKFSFGTDHRIRSLEHRAIQCWNINSAQKLSFQLSAQRIIQRLLHYKAV
jgi:hypothetical protein